MMKNESDRRHRWAIRVADDVMRCAEVGNKNGVVAHIMAAIQWSEEERDQRRENKMKVLQGIGAPR